MSETNLTELGLAITVRRSAEMLNNAIGQAYHGGLDVELEVKGGERIHQLERSVIPGTPHNDRAPIYVVVKISKLV